MGNLRSVQRGFARVGHESTVTDDPQILMQADKVVLPGVGAFADAMQQLHHRNLVEPLRLLAESGKPLLGICLGLQLLFEKSHENGTHAGMGLYPVKWFHFRIYRRSTKFRIWVGTNWKCGKSAPCLAALHLMRFSISCTLTTLCPQTKRWLRLKPIMQATSFQ